MRVVSRFRINFLVDSGATTLGLLARLLLILFLARVLATEEYAGFILANAVIAVGEIVSDFGTRTWATRNYALGWGLNEGLRFIFATKACYTVLFGVGVYLLLGAQLSIGVCLLIVLVSLVQPSSDPVLWLFRGREKLYLEGLFTLYWRLGASVAMYVVARATQELFWILMAWLVTSLIRLATELLWIKWRKMEPRAAKNSDGSVSLPQMLKLSRQVFPIGCALVFMCLYQRVGIFALSRMTSATTLAIYGTAFQFVAVPGFLAVSVANALFPRLSRSVHAGDSATSKRTVSQGLAVIAILFGGISLLGAVVAPWVFQLVMPKSLYAGHLVMQVLLPGLYISSLSEFLKTCMNALSLNAHDAGASALGILVFVLVLCVPHWRLPEIGAALAWNIGEAAIFAQRAAIMARDGRIDVRRTMELGALYLAVIAVTFVIAPLSNGLHDRLALNWRW